MAKRKTSFEKGLYYHLYNRGVNGEPIFFSKDNYSYLLRIIKKHIPSHHISMIGYCLMPNHYHFLVRQDSDVPVSEFMQRIFNAYTKGVNKASGRSGTLFEGPFKSKHIDSDEYLLHLCRYIHRNTIDTNPPLVHNPEDWPYSNYPEWISLRNGSLVDRNFISDCFSSDDEYKEFVRDTPALKVTQRLEKYLF